MRARLLQLCLTFCDAMACSPLLFISVLIMMCFGMVFLCLGFIELPRSRGNEIWKSLVLISLHIFSACSLLQGFQFTCMLGLLKLSRSSQMLFAFSFFSLGVPGGSVAENPPASAGDASLIPGLGRFPGEGNGDPHQYSCLENPMDKEAWWATVHRVSKGSDTTWGLNNNNIPFF